MKKIIPSIIAFLIIILIAGIAGTAIFLFQKKSEEKMLKGEIGLEKSKIPSDWIYYNHDVLGISFYYPPGWGEVRTSPRRIITNLEKINELRRENRENPNHISELHYTVYISFSPRIYGERTPRIKVYNDDFEGKIPPNTRLMLLGPIDNFLKIKESHDICDYSFEFDKRPDVDWYILKEIYNECERGIKTSIRQTRSKRENGDIYYSYSLKDYAFFKLRNNYFDNAIISYYYAGKQSFDGILKAEDIFIEAGEDYERKREEFFLFINSVDVFTPVLPEQKDFEIIENEDPNITTIRKYYYEIAIGNLEKAYEMYGEKNVDFETYESWYKETILVEPEKFERLKNNRYQFNVYFQDDNSEKELYRIVMKVDGGKITPISSEKILTEFISFENMTAFTMARHGNSYLVISKDGKEEILDIGAAEFSLERGTEKMLLGPLKFSPKGNYLMSYFSFFESGGIDVYDLDNKKNVLSLDQVSNLNFTDEEDYFFVCANDNTNYDKQYNAVYSVPDFKEIYRNEIFPAHYVLQDGGHIEKCSYDKEKEVIRFEREYLPGWDFEKSTHKETKKTKEIIEFSLVNKEVREVVE